MQAANLLILNDGLAVDEEGICKRRRPDREYMYAVDLKIFTVVGIAGVRILNIDGLEMCIRDR